MIKKVSIIAIISIILFASMSIYSLSYAVTGEEVLNSTQATELVEIKESTRNNLNVLLLME